MTKYFRHKCDELPRTVSVDMMMPMNKSSELKVLVEFLLVNLWRPVSTCRIPFLYQEMEGAGVPHVAQVIRTVSPLLTLVLSGTGRLLTLMES